MKDFNFYAPTRVVFGRESEEKLPELIKQYGGTKVLVHYGRGSARRSGLLDKVEKMLGEAGIAYVELAGVVPNPLLSKVREGIALCQRENVDFILAVGGGSVIDSAKAIGYGVGYEGDVWDFWAGKAIPQSCLPIGAMLTIPAAGSEMSSSCVITNDEGMLKRGVNSDLCRCKFAIMNPERTFTLPEYQTAAGGVDILMHTMERYFSKYEDAMLTDALAEALMRTVIEALPEVLLEPEDYKYRAALMWASSLSHNDLMECGTEKDFACHKLEHELSGMFGVTHGAGLAAIWSSWAYYVMDKHLNRFVKFAVNVMRVPQDFTNPRETAMRGIKALEDFFMSIEMPLTIPDVLDRFLTDEEIDALVDKCSRGGKMNIGAMEVLTPDDMRKIYRIANEQQVNIG
ncbi:iron-containing alcohol dehydrogenase [Prevotella sp. P6B1]|uniref:iron-containing alcohol dehydrogenase n=1 Tax=Prevotella sp. P6B1 TaxID=1410613 RepID=UPI00051C1248|nr:iron-containing alcohol dehydrogenase [Prevotella sp. P6B1]